MNCTKIDFIPARIKIAICLILIDFDTKLIENALVSILFEELHAYPSCAL